MSASYPLAGLVTIQYERLWRQRLQQLTSLLLPAVTTTDISGDRKRMQQLGALTMRAVTGRSLATVPDDSTIYDRWLTVAPFELCTWIAEWDAEAMASIDSPTGPHMEAHVLAYNRTIDAVIRDALGGSSLTGTDGTTSTALGSGQTVAVDYVSTGSAANSGLTFAKVAQAKYLMDVAKVPMAERTFVCGAQEQQDLILNVEQLVNSRYTNVQPITDGTLAGKTWMGFKWITDYQDLVVASSIRNCFALSKPMVAFGQNEKRASVDLLPLRSHTTQIRTRARMGATRLQEEGVVMVKTYHA